MARLRNSKARLVIEIQGPTTEVNAVVQTLTGAVGYTERPGVTIHYPEPIIIEPLVRTRRAKQTEVK